MFNVQCSDVIVCSLYIQAGDQKTMAVMCGGRGEVRSHGGLSVLITAATALCFIGGPLLVSGD